jgi:hypothetical protein
MVIRNLILATTLASALFGTTAHGAALPPIAFLSIGFKEATMADFTEGPWAAKRRIDASGYLAVTADFNGDGKADEARILLNEQRKVAYVVAVIQSPSKVDTYVLSQFALQDAMNVGIAPASPLANRKSRGLAGVTVFALDSGQGEASYFDGEDFNTRVASSAGAPKSK